MPLGHVRSDGRTGRSRVMEGGELVRGPEMSARLVGGEASGRGCHLGHSRGAVYAEPSAAWILIPNIATVKSSGT